MNALTKRARYNHKREIVTNYLIAAGAGIILGAMFALNV